MLGHGIWEIGGLVVPEFRGRGIGSAAQGLLVEYLFATTTAHRLWAGTEVGNAAEQRCLEKCGFAHEGLVRAVHSETVSGATPSSTACCEMAAGLRTRGGNGVTPAPSSSMPEAIAMTPAPSVVALPATNADASEPSRV